ncbi:MAG: double zinc ribbon domain-containing protein [Chloroflexota bacterium]
MEAPKRMPRYDVRNDGIGPYAVFYCDKCEREYRSQPSVGETIAKDIGRQAVGGFLRNIPLFGNAAAESVVGEDPRYVYALKPNEVEEAWQQVGSNFHECPTCLLVVCPSCWDPKAGFCTDDTPRREEIARAETEQAVGVISGLASAFGIGDVVKTARQAAEQSKAQLARCSNCERLAPAGTKFCPDCGTAMTQPAASVCPSCGQETGGAKFCPNCGAKVAQPAAALCAGCGVALNGAKFCPECGAKAG